MKKTIKEQLDDLLNTRDQKTLAMEALMSKATEEGRTLDTAEAEEFDTLKGEVDSIEKDIERLRALERIQASKAAQVAGNGTRPAEQSRAGVITVERNLPKGTGFTRYAIALARSKGNIMQAYEISKGWTDTPEVAAVLKAASDAGTTTDATWAAPLVNYQVLASEFIDLLRPQTIIGRIANLRRVPFNVKLPRQTSGGTYGWVGEAKPKPVGELAFDTVTLQWAKAAGIIVLTQELVRVSNPSAEALVRQDMIDGIASFLDAQFVDPDVAAVANTSPASVTNGVTQVIATGTDADAVRTDVATLWANTFLSNNNVPTNGVWIMPNVVAMRLSLMLNALGQREFPDISMTGGTFMGFPVVTSQNVPSDSDGNIIVFVNASDILLAEDTIMLDASTEASLQMKTDPDPTSDGNTVYVSMFQRNMIALRAEQFINWTKRRSSACGYIGHVNYGT